MKNLNRFSIYIFIFTLFLPIRNSFGQQRTLSDIEAVKKFLIVQPFKTTLLEQVEVDRVNKIILRACTKQQEFELAMTAQEDFEKSKIQVYQVQLLIEQQGDLFSAKALLVDLNKKTMVNKVEASKISRLSLIRKIEDLLDLLFKEAVAPSTPFKEKKRNLNVRAGQVDPTVAEENEAFINFRDRIKSIKSAIKDKMNEINASNITSETKANNEDDIQNLSSKNKVNSEQVLSDEILPVARIPIKPIKKHEVSVGYRSVNVRAKGLIVTNTATKYLDVNYGFSRNLFNSQSNFVLLTARYGKLISENENSLQDRLELGAGYDYHFQSQPVRLLLGLSDNTVSFANLPVRGEGLAGGNAAILSGYIGVIGKGAIKNFPASLAVTYSQPVLTRSDYLTIEEAGGLNGSKVAFNFLAEKVFKKFNVGFQYYVQNYDTKVADLSLSSYGVELYASLYF